MEQTNDLISQRTNEAKWVLPLGYLLLTVSSLLYIIEIQAIPDRGESNFTIFFIHYFISIGYWTAFLVTKRVGLKRSWNLANIDYTVLLMNLFLVSAFALNRELPVFEDSADWLCALIIVTSVSLLSYRFFKVVPKWVNKLQSIVLGMALTLYLYWAIYVANFYILGSLGVMALGIGGHIFVPILLLICTIALIRGFHTKKDNLFLAFGCFLVVSSAGVFCAVWNSTISAIEKRENQSVLNASDLPAWVAIGQTIKNDWISQRILKSDLVYTVSNDHFQWDFFSLNSRWEESKKHDPLVFIASLFKKVSLSRETRIKILQSITDDRHRAQERLWSGDNLTTSYVVSDVDIYPNLRLAYTEKYLNIKNNTTQKRWWGSTEEAIYTFQLPEGSIVTSLSLWIDGKEEKSILTSKQKADTAYKTIVGVERRDPSVVHWQEGSTVSVRIFPCTEKEERKFKIGITSPLPEKNGRVVYRNISFRGPNPADAKETARIRFMTEPSQLEMQSSFKKDKKGDYQLEHDYDPNLSISFASTPIKENQFSFDGFTYTLSEYKPEVREAHIEKIYLDINDSWSKNEIDDLRPLLSTRTLYAFVDNELIKLNNGNWNEITADLSTQNFTLFPFYLIKDIEHALVISKGKELSPHLSDIKESVFAKRISSYFSTGKKVKLFCLDGSTSTYVSSFRELRGLDFASGDIGQLNTLLKLNQFPLYDESDNKIILHDAHLTIHKTSIDSTKKNNSPDHLARLFAYNDIMRKVGTNYFNESFINDDLIKEASSAYVVSPVSSLIVLESQKDYDRFGIKDEGNSLHNASKASSGAVPEPHEWMLIIVFGMLVLFATWKKYKLTVAK